MRGYFLIVSDFSDSQHQPWLYPFVVYLSFALDSINILCIIFLFFALNVLAEVILYLLVYVTVVTVILSVNGYCNS